MSVAELLVTSRAAQGLAERVEDPATLSRVVVLLAADKPAGGGHDD